MIAGGQGVQRGMPIRIGMTCLFTLPATMMIAGGLFLCSQQSGLLITWHSVRGHRQQACQPGAPGRNAMGVTPDPNLMPTGSWPVTTSSPSF